MNFILLSFSLLSPVVIYLTSTCLVKRFVIQLKTNMTLE